MIAGGGKVAARKVERLAAFGPKLTVVAPKIEECVRKLAGVAWQNGACALFLQERAFRMADLEGADFVIAATDDEALNSRISDACKERRIPVNVVDDRAKCSFLFPALVRDGPLTIGICTDGRSPAAAAWVRKEISQRMPQGLGKIVDLMGQIRPWVMGLDLDGEARRDLMERMFLHCMERGGEVELEELVDRYGQDPDRDKRK